MPDLPTEEEIQRLMETHPGMHDRAVSLLKSLIRGDLTPQSAMVEITEIKIQADENLATARKLAAARGIRHEDH